MAASRPRPLVPHSDSRSLSPCLPPHRRPLSSRLQSLPRKRRDAGAAVHLRRGVLRVLEPERHALCWVEHSIVGLSDFGRLVLLCINSYDCEKRRILQH